MQLCRNEYNNTAFVLCSSLFRIVGGLIAQISADLPQGCEDCWAVDLLTRPWRSCVLVLSVLRVCFHFQLYRSLPATRRQQPHLWGHGNAQVFWNVSGCFQWLFCSGRGHRRRHRYHIFSFTDCCVIGSLVKLYSLTVVHTWPSSPSWGISSCWRQLSSSSCRGALSCWQRPVASQVAQMHTHDQLCQEWLNLPE